MGIAEPLPLSCPRRTPHPCGGYYFMPTPGQSQGWHPDPPTYLSQEVRVRPT